MKTCKVFVYGTLLTGEYNHRVAEPFIKSVTKGVVKGRLYSVGPFPALVPDRNAQDVKGEWFEVTEEGLRNMDRLEGYREGAKQNHYDRVLIKDEKTGETGYVYVYTEEKATRLPLIENGSWKERGSEYRGW